MTKDSLIHLLSIPHVIGLLLQIRSTMKMAVGIVNLFVKPMTATPNYQLKYDYKHEKMLRAFNTLYAEYEIIKNLKFKTTFSMITLL